MGRAACLPMSMESKRPQLNLAELHQLKWLLGGVLAVLSAWTIFYMEVAAWTWLIMITVAVPVVLAKPELTTRVPRWAHRLAFPLLVGGFVVDLALHLKEPLIPVIRLTLMLIFYRVITPRQRRDDLQLILLGLFLVVVGGVMSVSILFAAQIVVFTACALGFLLVITLTDAMEQGLTVDDEAKRPGEVPAWMRMKWGRLAERLRQCVDWRVAVFGGLLFGGVVVLSAVLFMAIPRFELGNSLFLDRMISRKAKTGFSENIQFGDVVDIQRDTSVALRVEVSDHATFPALPYWRMLVLDEYKAGGLRMSAVLRRSLDATTKNAGQIQGDKRLWAGAPIWTFYLEAGTSRFLPLLGEFNQLTFDGGSQDAGLEHGLRVVTLGKEPVKMLAYRVEGMAFGPALKTIDTDEEAAKKRDNRKPTLLDLPGLLADDQQKLGAWVAEIGAPPDSPSEFARRACAWLKQRHVYSLQSAIRSGTGDTLVRWIGSKEPGHCELFAGAFLLLARTAGYPTRVVLGFKGGSWNPHSENLTIRNSDAHAWCEIFDRTSDTWVRVDPTPGSVPMGEATNAVHGEAALTRIQDDGWSARFESLQMFWYRRIVSFDQQSQLKLADTTKKLVDGRMRSLKKMLRERLVSLKRWLKEPWDVRRISWWTVLVLLPAGLLVGWRVQGRSAWLRWRSRHSRSGIDPVRREAGRWLQKIQTEGAWSLELAVVRAELERLRYGARHVWPEPVAVFSRTKRALAILRRRSLTFVKESRRNK